MAMVLPLIVPDDLDENRNRRHTASRLETMLVHIVARNRNK